MRDLLQRFSEVLCEMNLLAEGHTTSWNAKVSGGKASSSAPRHTERLYDKHVDELRLTLYRAERDLDRYKRGRAAVEDKEDRDKRIIEEYVGQPAVRVAIFVDLSQSQVRRIREQHDRNPADGTPL